MTSDVELATHLRSKLIVDGDGHPIHAEESPRARVPHRPRELLPMVPEADLSGLLGSLRDQIARTLRRSLHIRHLDAGSCNGCDWELTALLNPVHDIQQYGIDFVASPRHADLLIVTGVMTRNLTLAAIRTYRAMPGPRLVVAVGACGCSGGIFGASYAGGGGTDTVLPVDIYIPGCPPHPQALIHGLLLAMGRIKTT
jgi:Ni,Fe-hydrogenase III small subunit